MPRAFRRTAMLGAVVLLGASCQDSPSAPRSDADPVDPVPRATMSTDTFDTGYRTTLAANGDVVVIGSTEGSLDGPSAGGEDVFVRRYHPDGDLIWGRQFGSAQVDQPLNLATSSDGSVYVVGITNGSIAGWRGSQDGFVRAFDSEGNELWTRQVGTAGEDALADVAVGADGFIYVGGYTNGVMGASGLGDNDGILRKYTAQGDVVWTRQFGTDSSDAVLAVEMGDSGSIIVAGVTTGMMRLTDEGAFDAFVRRYTPDGTATWTRQEGSAGDDTPWGVGVDDLGRVHVAGYTAGNMFGALGGTQDGFYWRMSRTGTNQITEQFGTGEDEFVYALAVDAGRNAYLVGTTEGALEGPGTNSVDAFIRKYLPSGAIGWTRQSGSDSADSYVGVAASDVNNIFVSGGTNGAMGPAHAGNRDAFVRRLDSDGQTIWTDQ